jgi:type I restriction enzyme M protein
MTSTKPIETLEQDQINRAVWSACDTFRGIIDSSVYKDYVLTMLFLKYISDVWQDHYENYQQKDFHPELIDEFLKKERFVLPHEANFYTLYQHRHQSGNGERIDTALSKIAQSNETKLEGVFQDIQFNSTKLGDEKQKNAILCQLLEDLNKPELNLQPSRVGNLDIIGNAYEFLIRHFASSSGKKAGEFYTPPEISELMARLIDPQVGDSICDPTCGSGSLLMKCGKLVQQRHHSPQYQLYGQEAIGSTWALAKMNMMLHSQDQHRIEWGDTLREPKLLNPDGSLLQFDAVVANPPFSLEKWGHESALEDRHQRFERGVPPPGRADYAFILHMIATMKPDSGRMVVVAPAGVLFRKGQEGAIRKKLLQENLLDTVIGLPEKLFYGTGIAAVILLLRHQRKDRNVLLIDASCEFQEGKGQNWLSEANIARILDACQQRESQPDFAHLASMPEIISKKYDLNISNYVVAREQQAIINLTDLHRERDTLAEQASALALHIDQLLTQLVAECPTFAELIKPPPGQGAEGGMGPV